MKSERQLLVAESRIRPDGEWEPDFASVLESQVEAFVGHRFRVRDVRFDYRLTYYLPREFNEYLERFRSAVGELYEQSAGGNEANFRLAVGKLLGAKDGEESK